VKYLLFLLPTLLSASELSVILLGFAHHGIAPEGQRVIEKMDNRLDSKGIWTKNPQLNLSYHTDSNWTTNVSYIKNSFNKNAFHLGIGKRIPIFKHTYGGLMLGYYIYERIEGIIAPESGQIGGYNYILTPWVTLQQDIPLTNRYKFTLIGSTNYVISHIGLGFTYKFNNNK
jgi:hypothetical protein